MAQRTGETLTEAVINALRERLEREALYRCRCLTRVAPTKFLAMTRTVCRDDH
ncbi:MAG: type II toxin-antitoxin system VapB family antitoxin [Xanthobacteraceae bacterium]